MEILPTAIIIQGLLTSSKVAMNSIHIWLNDEVITSNGLARFPITLAQIQKGKERMTVEDFWTQQFSMPLICLFLIIVMNNTKP